MFVLRMDTSNMYFLHVPFLLTLHHHLVLFWHQLGVVLSGQVYPSLLSPISRVEIMLSFPLDLDYAGQSMIPDGIGSAPKQRAPSGEYRLSIEGAR